MRKYEKKYTEVLNYLKEKGLISARWISEFNLYVITKTFFPDAIYQYREAWLGLQSIDIFIPSKKIAIEYQGQQHYEEITFFDGEEGLRKRKERDEVKRKKCLDNGIILVEWSYLDDVDTNNFKRIMKSFL